MNNPTALVLICTGRNYWRFLQPAVESAKKFFPADILLLTDCGIQFDVAKQVYIPHAGWPNVTLMRYHVMLKQREWLSQYKHIFYLDIDMQVVSQVGDEILSDGITACVHTAYAGGPGTPEENPHSAAYVNRNNIKAYYTGCFIGGKASAFFSLMEGICKSTDIDNANGFLARWHDESHLNRYLYDHPPAKDLHDEYNAYSRKDTTKILRITKGAPDRPAKNGSQPFDIRNQIGDKGCLLAIVSCKAYACRAEIQKKSWIMKAIAAGYDVQIFDGERLGVPDDYLNLKQKTKALCVWALERGYSGVLKMDDDTFVWVENFKEVKEDYAGIRIIANDGGSEKLKIPPAPAGTYPLDYACGGAYWLSKRSMEIIAKEPFNEDWAEDRWVGHTLARHNIQFKALEDYDQAFHHQLESYLERSLAVLTQIPEDRISEMLTFAPKKQNIVQMHNIIRAPRLISSPKPRTVHRTVVDRRRPR